MQKNIDGEVKERKVEDLKLNQKIDDVDFDLNEKMNKEINDRNAQIKQIKEEIKEEVDKQRKFVSDFKEKVPDCLTN